MQINWTTHQKWLIHSINQKFHTANSHFVRVLQENTFPPKKTEGQLLPFLLSLFYFYARATPTNSNSFWCNKDDLTLSVFLLLAYMIDEIYESFSLSNLMVAHLVSSRSFQTSWNLGFANQAIFRPKSKLDSDQSPTPLPGTIHGHSLPENMFLFIFIRNFFNKFEFVRLSFAMVDLLGRAEWGSCTLEWLSQ